MPGNYLALVRRICSSRWDFRLPKHVDVLIVFTTNSDLIAGYFPERSVATIDIASSQKNFWMVIHAVFTGGLNIRSYLKSYIRFARPSLVVSMQDNFPALWLLHGQVGNTKIALIQNGLRTDLADSMPIIHSTTEVQPRVDYYFCFNKAIADTFKTYVSAQFVPIGSFRSNSVSRQQLAKTKSISYISTYRPAIPPNTTVGITASGNVVTYQGLFTQRLRIIRQITQYCESRNLRLRVLGKDLDALGELEFYRQILPKDSFEFVPRPLGHHQYEACDQSFIVVSTSSTLGYEALSRGIRTAVFNFDSTLLNTKQYRFGWPVDLPEEGPFWSNKVDPPSINRILDSLFEMPEESWSHIVRGFSHCIPTYDEHNEIFVKTLAGVWS